MEIRCFSFNRAYNNSENKCAIIIYTYSVNYLNITQFYSRVQ